MLAGVSLYARNILVGIDQLANAIFGGDPDETISSRLQRYRRENQVANEIAMILDDIDPGHCEQSLEPEDHHTNDFLK